MLTFRLCDPYGHDETVAVFNGDEEAAVANILMARLFVLDYEILVSEDGENFEPYEGDGE